MNLLKRLQICVTCILLCSMVILFTYETRVNRMKLYPKTLPDNNSIVAFSFEKLMELQRKDFDCGDDLNAGLTNQIPATDDSESSSDTDTWQQVPGMDVFLYSAFHDTRIEKQGYIRIIAMVKGELNTTCYCQIRFKTSSKRFVTEATVSPIWSDTWNQNDTHQYYNPMLVSCPTPRRRPTHVSIAPAPCQSTDVYKRIHTRNASEPHRNFTVCVKNINYAHDISQRLIEWLELHRLLGAAAVYLYVDDVVGRVRRVVDTYSRPLEGGFAVVARQAPPPLAQYPSPTPVTFWQQRRNHLITYNDCFYRNIETSRFVVPVDLDEVIVPRDVDTWQQLFAQMFASGPHLDTNYASFMVQNAYFFKHNNIGKSRPFTSQHTGTTAAPMVLRHLYRSQFSPPGVSGKSFISTKNSLTIFNHYTLTPLLPAVRRAYFVPIQTAQMNHYRELCSFNILPECIKYVKDKIHDPIMLKYANQLVGNLHKMVAIF